MRKGYVIIHNRYAKSLELLHKLAVAAKDDVEHVKHETEKSLLAARKARDLASKAIDRVTAETKSKEAARTAALLEEIKAFPEALAIVEANAEAAVARAEEAEKKASAIVKIAAKERSEAVALAASHAETLAETLAEPDRGAR